MTQPLLEARWLKRLEILRLLSRQSAAGMYQGERRSGQRGSGQEFADYRAYVQGDDFRRIDWNAFAKNESLMVRLFELELDRTVHLVLDTSASMGYGSPGKQAFAQRLAGSLSYLALKGGEAVQLHRLGGAMEGRFQGRSSAVELWQRLGAISGGGAVEMVGALTALSRRLTRPGLVILISDLWSSADLAPALRRLACQRHELWIFQILSPQEAKPELRGEFRLRDMESSEVLEMSLQSATLELYQERLGAIVREFQTLARSMKALYLQLQSDQDMEEIFCHQLRRAGVIG